MDKKTRPGPKPGATPPRQTFTLRLPLWVYWHFHSSAGRRAAAQALEALAGAQGASAGSLPMEAVLFAQAQAGKPRSRKKPAPAQTDAGQQPPPAPFGPPPAPPGTEGLSWRDQAPAASPLASSAIPAVAPKTPADGPAEDGESSLHVPDINLEDFT